MSNASLPTAGIPSLAADAVCVPLGGGHVNKTWRVQSGGREYVLRRDTALAGELGLDRERELSVLRALAGKGIAPDIAHADPAAGILLTVFVAGQTCSAEDFAAPARAEQLAATLERLWGVRSGAAHMDYAACAARYAERLGSTAAMELAAACKQLARRWCGDHSRYVLCHHDLSPENMVVVADGGLRFIDWEYAALGEPCFELAVIEAWGGPVSLLAGHLAAGGRALEPERLAGCRELYRRLSALWLMLVCGHPDSPAPYQRDLEALLSSRNPL